MNTQLLNYNVGPLLYCPAANSTVSNSIIHEKFGKKFSLALCLEDTIDDHHVEEAETILQSTLNTIANASINQEFYIPKIFVRVRTPDQIPRLFKQFDKAKTFVNGFIIPKISLENADDYIHQIEEVNSLSDQTIYMMPIFESTSMIHLQKRYDILYGLKEKLDKIPELILNLRVGGNDLCHAFGFRRKSTETIYDIKPVANILSDISTVFGMDYILSGPVWEYYNGFHWKTGLENELQKDRLNGFVGKTVIHPKQISIVNKAYMVSKQDYEDAKAILNWNTDNYLLVSGNTSLDRMNEYKTHCNWATKIIALSKSYGIK
jgi:citrate lyase beta subunit